MLSHTRFGDLLMSSLAGTVPYWLYSWATSTAWVVADTEPETQFSVMIYHRAEMTAMTG